jgi:hypothetical protein
MVSVRERTRGGSIEKQVRQALNALNAQAGYPKPLVPSFHDIRIVNEPANWGLLRHLRQKGCVVIIDTVSLRHPILLKAFQQSLLEAYPTTSVLSLAPKHEALALIQDMTYALQLTLRESELGRRRRDLLEGYACEELGAMDGFPRWFVERVRQLCGPAAAQGGILQQMKS